MKKSIQQSLLSVIMVLVTLSCNHQDEPLTSTFKQGVNLKNGRVVFGSLEDFKKTIISLKNMNDDERVGWEKKMGHNSMMTYYEQNEGIVLGTENPIYKTMQENKPYISDILFGRIVNSEGLFQIGSDVHKITNDGRELVTNEKFISFLDKNEINKNVQSKAISVVVEPATKTPNNARIGGEENIARREVKDGHMATAYFSRSNYWLYNSFAMKLRLEKEEGWWIFRSMRPKQAEYLEIVDSGYSYQEPFNPSAGRGQARCSDCSEAYAFLGESFGPTTFAHSWTKFASCIATYEQTTVAFSNY